jgi:hypothetical protein
MRMRNQKSEMRNMTCALNTPLLKSIRFNLYKSYFRFAHPLPKLRSLGRK